MLPSMRYYGKVIFSGQGNLITLHLLCVCVFCVCVRVNLSVSGCVSCVSFVWHIEQFGPRSAGTVLMMFVADSYMSKRKGGSDIRQFFGQPQKRKKSKEREGERECEHGDRTGRVCAGDMEIIPSSRDSEFDNERESSQAGENEGTGKEGEELGLCPNHPNVKVIPSQTLSNRILYFQDKWFKDHTWLHYSPSVKGVLCFYCAKYFAAQKSKLASKADSALSLKDGSNKREEI
ncbi:hypothetical protein F7725_013461 [Dissostichus mawsoni]|uniref:TTF-type domain-containing protein n=1 Tax=Dissostichus mawsoni TaxID=36200 RepID=A0A7J5YSK7_DISMA|nr:hypothetical protein F7725_013461 [Dissostichus mawsoni]